MLFNFGNMDMMKMGIKKLKENYKMAKELESGHIGIRTAI